MAATGSKKKRREEIARKKHSKKKTKIVMIVLGLALVLALGGWYALSENNRPGQSIVNMGGGHLPPGSPERRYNSSPPTSGPHANPARWGRHTSEIRKINQVHNLEHGGVLIQYNCQHETLRDRCDNVRQELSTALQAAREEIDTKIILAPYSQMDQPIALTAWTRLQYLTEPDTGAILRFIRGNINRAPEQVE